MRETAVAVQALIHGHKDTLANKNFILYLLRHQTVLRQRIKVTTESILYTIL